MSCSGRALPSTQGFHAWISRFRYICTTTVPASKPQLLLKFSAPTLRSEMVSVSSETEDVFSRYMPLHKAAIKGDWESAKSFFDSDRAAVTAIITEYSETVLHIVVGTRNNNATHFVEQLLKLIPPDVALETLTDRWGETPLDCAAVYGNTEAAQLLVKHSPHLPNINNVVWWSWWPIQFAAHYEHRDMVSYLMTVTKDDVDPNPLTGKHGVDLLKSLITAEFYDLALQLVQRHPSLATSKSSDGDIALCMLAGKPSAFLSGSQFNFWQRFIYSRVLVKLENNSNKSSGGEVGNPAKSSQVHAQLSSLVPFFISVWQKLRAVLWEVIGRLAPQIKRIEDTKTMHEQTRQLIKCLCTDVTSLGPSKATMFKLPLHLAAKLGIHEIVEEILEKFPSIIWYWDDNNYRVFQLAIMNRRENVFNLLNQVSRYRHALKNDRNDAEWNNSLHSAAKLAPPHRLKLVSGAALQMQRELQWYKEVENFVPPAYKEQENKHGKTPAVLFSEEHKNLVEVGEQWMKDTANSCTIAAALIATIAFAAAITVPGGNDGQNGLPIFSKDIAFIIFAISNALSLFSATASLLMFLSILTARYAEDDFLYALPKRLIIGLVTLFLSITAMMMTFSATLYLVFVHKKAWILIPVAALASLPVTLFVSLQFPLLVDMIKSTYGPGIFGNKK